MVENCLKVYPTFQTSLEHSLVDIFSWLNVTFFIPSPSVSFLYKSSYNSLRTPSLAIVPHSIASSSTIFFYPTLLPRRLFMSRLLLPRHPSSCSFVLLSLSIKHWRRFLCLKETPQRILLFLCLYFIFVLFS